MATIDSLVEATVIGDDDLFLIDQGGEGKKIKGNILGSTFDYTSTVAKISTGGYQVGKFVKILDRDSEVFEIVSSGTPDGLGILNAGVGKVAIYRPKYYINPKAFGAKYDGVTVDTDANNYASVWSTALLMPVHSPAGVCITGNITYYSKFHWKGSGVFLSVFKAVNGGTSDIFTSANFDSLTGTNSDDGTHDVIIEDLSIDGNRERDGNLSGITTGKGLRLYGRTNRFRRLKIYNCAEDGLISEWGDGVSLSLGLEGIFEDIEIYYNGKNGWIFRGPHDSHCLDIFCHSNSQSDSGVYENLAVEKGNARWTRIHTYSLFYGPQGFPSLSARQKTSTHIYRAAEGNEFNQCHIEGGNTNLNNEANGTKVINCRIYYPWSTGVNIINSGSSVTIEATLGEEYKGIGLPLAKGLVLGGDYGGVSNSTFILNGTGMEAGWVDFGGSNGSNSFTIRGFNATVGNTAYLGQPNTTDDVDLYVSGANLTTLKRSLIQTAHPPLTYIPTGSVQNDAKEIYKYTRYVKVVTANPDSGLRMANPSEIKSGNKVTIFNKTASSVKLYPSIGGDLLGYGINNPVIIPPLKTVDVLVDDEIAGTFLVAGPY